MSDTKLGILLEGYVSRDAIHVAICPVTTTEILHPGQHVGLVKGSTTTVTAQTKKLIGIVDPFLKTKVFPGDQFYLCLYQQTVTGMTHVWRHDSFPEVVVPVGQLAGSPPPAAPPAPDKGIAEQWLRAFAGEWNMIYDDMIENAVSGYGLTARNRDIHGWNELGGDQHTFWAHLETVTGRTFSATHRDGTYFSCSC